MVVMSIVLLFAAMFASTATRDRFGDAAAVVGVALLLAHYLHAWWRVGRDPQRGTIMPIYEPPQGMSAAAMRYLVRRGFDFKVFLVTLVGMAAKRYITVKQVGGVYQLTRTDAADTVLNAEERTVALQLFEDARSIKLEDNYRGYIRDAIERLRSLLQSNVEQTLFNPNTEWMRAGLILSAAVIFASALLSPMGPGMLILIPALALLSFFTGLLAYLAALFWAGPEERAPAGKSGRWVGALLLSVLALLFTAAEYFLLRALWHPALWRTLLVSLAAVGVNLAFYRLLKAPTPLGRQTLDHIEGFRMFLTSVEQDRLDRMAPPEKTPELFERYLPYAMALDVEHHWAAQFQHLLSFENLRAAEQANVYAGVDWFGMDPIGFLGWLFGSMREIVTAGRVRAAGQ
jgi:hypothetical protein